jgi:hypothetical protein
MRASGQKSEIAQAGISNVRSLFCRRTQAVLVAAAALFLTSTLQIAAQKATATEQENAVRPHKPTTKASPQPAPVPPEQVVPKPPDWPANDRPAEAKVAWNSKGLRVDAANSSLQQILKDVATATGAKVSGLSSDQRVFGTFGPGTTRDVISQLLDGSGYNVLMIGDQGQGTPRQIVLSKQPNGPAPMVTNNSAASNDDSGSADVEEPPPPQPPPPQPQQLPQQNGPNGFTPGMQPRTPQQILQEMQQRQQQIEQQQQQQRTNPQ